MNSGNRRLLEIFDVVRSRPFERGLRESMAAKPFVDQWVPYDQAVAYEVGRLTGAQLGYEGSQGPKVYYYSSGRLRPGRLAPLARAAGEAAAVWMPL